MNTFLIIQNIHQYKVCAQNILLFWIYHKLFVTQEKMAYLLAENRYRCELHVKYPIKKMSALRVVYLKNNKSQSQILLWDSFLAPVQI